MHWSRWFITFDNGGVVVLFFSCRYVLNIQLLSQSTPRGFAYEATFLPGKIPCIFQILVVFNKSMRTDKRPIALFGGHPPTMFANLALAPIYLRGTLAPALDCSILTKTIGIILITPPFISLFTQIYVWIILDIIQLFPEFVDLNSTLSCLIIKLYLHVMD